MILMVTIRANMNRRGSMATFRFLLSEKAEIRFDWAVSAGSAVITSFVPSRVMSSMVASIPSEAPLVSIATVVTVVVTVEIMADNQSLFGDYYL